MVFCLKRGFGKHASGLWESASQHPRRPDQAAQLRDVAASDPLQAIDGQRITLSAPSKWIKEWFQDNYQDDRARRAPRRRPTRSSRSSSRSREPDARAGAPAGARGAASPYAGVPVGETRSRSAHRPARQVHLRHVRGRPVEPARARRVARGRRGAGRQVQPALHLRRRRSRQDPPGPRDRPPACARSTRSARILYISRPRPS